jgi:hypothetical protein
MSPGYLHFVKDTDWQDSFTRILQLDSGDIIQLSVNRNIQPFGYEVCQVFQFIIEFEN